MKKPGDLLIYYGYLNSFNYNTNGSHSWNNEKVSQDISRYSCVVIGDGLQDPSHTDFANTKIILTRVKELNPSIKICGYVSLYQSMELYKKKAAQWKALDVDFIFVDEMGYDYGTVATNGRAAMVEKVEFVHSMSMGVFANSWNPDHVLSNDPADDDTGKPNSSWNPELLESPLRADDIYLLESHAITSAGAYEAKAQWYDRGVKARQYDIKLAAVSAFSDGDANGQSMFDFVYTSALMNDLDYVGTSDSNFGATNSATKMWARPDASRIPDNDWVIIASDANRYFRFMVGSHLELDFSSGSESSAISHN